MLLPVRVSPVC